ncbi:MAG: TetR/AcrR family transcriptional regulator [Bacteroidota bacterium]
MSDTADRLLDHAQALVQTRGFNAFSFRDLARALDLTNAGVHYHFPSKADLGRALVARYRRTFATTLATVERSSDDPRDRLAGFVDVYTDVLRQGRLCLCGILASDAATLPPEVRGEVRAFFDETERWLARVLAEGRASGLFQFDGEADAEAALTLAAVEGAMITAWPLRSGKDGSARATERFETVTGRLLQGLTGP